MNFLTKVIILTLILSAPFALSAEEQKYDFTKLAPVLINAKGEKAKLNLKDKKYILVYYSSDWCGTCKEFTPKFVDFYNQSSKGVFEVIFMSLDFSEPKQLAHMKKTSMPWLAVKFSELKPSGLFEFVGATMPWISIFKTDGTLVAQQNVDLTNHTFQEVLAGLRKTMKIEKPPKEAPDTKKTQPKPKGCCIAL